MSNTKALTWAFEQNNDNITLHINGVLSRETLLPLWEQRYSFLPLDNIVHQKIIWELAGLTRVDSAGFALLCDFIHQCEKKVQVQIIANAPKQLLTLADLFGLSKWINLFDNNNGKNN